MAVGHERAHAEFLGQGEGLSVVVSAASTSSGSRCAAIVTEEAQGIRLVAAFLVFTGERQRLLGEGMRLLQAASQQMRLPQGETTEHLKDYQFHCNVCSIACVSSGTASAMRPPRVYAAPKAAATLGE